MTHSLQQYCLRDFGGVRKKILEGSGGTNSMTLPLPAFWWVEHCHQAYQNHVYRLSFTGSEQWLLQPVSLASLTNTSEHFSKKHSKLHLRQVWLVKVPVLQFHNEKCDSTVKIIGVWQGRNRNRDSCPLPCQPSRSKRYHWTNLKSAGLQLAHHCERMLSQTPAHRNKYSLLLI